MPPVKRGPSVRPSPIVPRPRVSVNCRGPLPWLDRIAIRPRSRSPRAARLPLDRRQVQGVGVDPSTTLVDGHRQRARGAPVEVIDLAVARAVGGGVLAGEHPARQTRRLREPESVSEAALANLSSTFAVFSGSAEVCLPGALEGRNGPSPRTQGGDPGQYHRPTPHTIDHEAAPSRRRGPPPATGPTAPPEPAPEAAALAGTAPPRGPQGRPQPPPAQADLRPAPRAGPGRLRAAGNGPDPTDLSAARPAGAGRHPHCGRAHHRQPAPHPGRLGPGPPQQFSPRPLPPPLVHPPADTPVHRRRLGPLRPARHRRAGRRRYRH